FNIMVDSIKSKIDELELSVHQREDFVSNFTHELKTPMTSIMGYAKVLKQDKYTKEDKEKAIDYIYSESKRLETLSHKLLDLLELSDGQINMTTINTKEYFKEFEALAKARLNPINLKLDIENSNILGDADLLTTCFMNLVENGKKASEENSEIRIVGKKKKDKYKLWVIDKGIGIESKELSRITENFYMVDRSRSKKKGGYGIGLSLCERIAKLHNTNLTFESVVGEGTTVSLELEMVKNETK
ncbi:MAG: HAMP domain-containing histidine kinase, partial [Bacilli bacterium]|nr:HAMP domain-containing histidine kinase [Bacilli bacterium]